MHCFPLLNACHWRHLSFPSIYYYSLIIIIYLSLVDGEQQNWLGLALFFSQFGWRSTFYAHSLCFLYPVLIENHNISVSYISVCFVCLFLLSLLYTMCPLWYKKNKNTLAWEYEQDCYREPTILNLYPSSACTWDSHDYLKFWYLLLKLVFTTRQIRN